MIFNAFTKDADGNYTVKIEGCTVLKAPKIQEYVNGEWVDYQYSTDIGFDGYAVACDLFVRI